MNRRFLGVTVFFAMFGAYDLRYNHPHWFAFDTVMAGLATWTAFKEET